MNNLDSLFNINDSQLNISKDEKSGLLIEREQSQEEIECVDDMPKIKKKKRKKGLVLNVFLSVIGIILVVLCLSNIYQKWFNSNGYTGFFGVGEAVVTSQSMEPKINKGDLVFYKKSNGADVKVGDTVIYKKETPEQYILVIHDIINIDGNVVTTKGINNAIADESFESNLIVGKYMFRLPQVGSLLSLISTPYSPFIILILIFIIAIIKIELYYIKKNRTLKRISVDQKTRTAIGHFFDL